MSNDGKPSMALFWGCFIALITTSYAFFSRMYLCDVRLGDVLNIDKGTIGALKGAGIWPFAISIILWSLVIDRIGYKIAMLFSFISYVIYAAMAFMAYSALQGVTGDALAAAQKSAYNLLYWGSVILGLGNGTVEAFINPVVATMFSKDKTKWLNILHAGWPGGLVVGGICTIALADYAKTGDWRIVLGLVLVPAVIYLIMLLGATFPKNEREAAGVGYVDMLKELGVFGAFVSFALIFAQLDQVPELKSIFFSPNAKWIYTGIVAVIFGVITKSFGRPLLAFMIVIMMPLATTEIGTDGWIGGLMEKPMEAAGKNPGWVLVYTSAIMMVLRFFAGPIVHSLSAIGLLIISAILAIAGLTALSFTATSGLLAIFAAATLYAFGKTFFWPTMLGITAEQSPKGGALTLNAISGIGMLAVGILGFPFIGSLQEDTTTKLISAKNSALVQQIGVDKSYVLGAYKAIDPEKAAAVTAEVDKALIAEATKGGQFTALGKMAMFPTFMLVCYLAMFFYFKSRGGYKAVDINAAH
ncbi:MAG: MFS transporter [Verrucomicrobiaceae bacterium]|jgi:MFS family permease|nr:MFS transporter [Verrucomicrobiaceae bacterium]